MKQTLIRLNLQRDGTRNGLLNIKETFAESLQLQMSVLHQRMSIFQSLMLVSPGSYGGCAKCKEKVLDMSDPNQNVEATFDSKLKFSYITLRFIHRRNAEKLVQHEYMYVALANTAVLNIRIFSRRYHFGL